VLSVVLPSLVAQRTVQLGAAHPFTVQLPPHVTVHVFAFVQSIEAPAPAVTAQFALFEQS
jgi:hypothetical protein